MYLGKSRLVQIIPITFHKTSFVYFIYYYIHAPYVLYTYMYTSRYIQYIHWVYKYVYMYLYTECWSILKPDNNDNDHSHYPHPNTHTMKRTIRMYLCCCQYYTNIIITNKQNIIYDIYIFVNKKSIMKIRRARECYTYCN